MLILYWFGKIKLYRNILCTLPKFIGNITFKEKFWKRIQFFTPLIIKFVVQMIAELKIIQFIVNDFKVRCLLTQFLASDFKICCPNDQRRIKIKKKISTLVLGTIAYWIPRTLLCFSDILVAHGKTPSTPGSLQNSGI